MRCLILGASAGLGRCLAEQLAARGDDLILVASDKRDLEVLANDLRLRFDIDADPIAVDFRSLEPSEFKRRVEHGRGSPAVILLVAGLGYPQDTGILDSALVDDLVNVNFRAGVAILTAFMPEMLAGKVSAVVGVGSVAAIRGRRTNMIYGAAKRGLEFYFEALRHRLAGADCVISFYRIGFMKTTMLARTVGPLPAVSPGWVAGRIIANLHRDSGLAYLPGWWGVIGLLLRLLPWTVFRRLDI